MPSVARSKAWVYGCCGRDTCRRIRPHSTTRARIHHHHPVAQLGGHTKIVRDDHDGSIGAPLQPAEKIEDLSLNRDVEGRGWLIGNDQVRLAQAAPAQS